MLDGHGYFEESRGGESRSPERRQQGPGKLECIGSQSHELRTRGALPAPLTSPLWACFPFVRPHRTSNTHGKDCC